MHLVTVLVSGMFALTLAGCASTSRPSVEATDYKSRAMTLEEGGVRASVAVLSAEESSAVYGVPLAEKGVQPVWVEIANAEDRAYWLLAPGLDPSFFPASEAAEAFRGTLPAGTHASHSASSGLRSAVPYRPAQRHPVSCWPISTRV
jgi:hypothetical protein